MLPLLESQSNSILHKLPWWTWLVPYLILSLGNSISLSFKFDTGIGSLYLPTTLSIILINWWGPARTLPATYICAALFAPFWGVAVWWQWLIYPICETAFAATSWLLFTKLAKGKYWLPNTRHFLHFILIGLLFPIVANILSLQSLLTFFGEQPKELFWRLFLTSCLSEFTAIFGICTPALYSLTRILHENNLLRYPPDYALPKPHHKFARLEPVSIYAALLALSFFVPFERYWYLYGLAGLFVAIRFGFGEALTCNLVVFFVTYIIPNFNKTIRLENFSYDDPLFNIFIGNILLYVFVAFTGRVISDLWQTEQKLNDKLKELNQTNAELDRFVYSVSHDLSAPLKSIQGLVNISKLDPSIEARAVYLSKIGTSVNKLDHFIKEILDYSRNNRLVVHPEKIDLDALCIEMIEDLQYMDNFTKIKFDVSSLAGKTITTDKLRLEIILKNLLSNAIKFQKKENHDLACVRLCYVEGANTVKIVVEDNGEGMKAEVIPNIFNMFFRGHQNSNGSGLGLYIAREVAGKIAATIKVSSDFGKGSTFIVEIPKAR